MRFSSTYRLFLFLFVVTLSGAACQSTPNPDTSAPVLPDEVATDAGVPEAGDYTIELSHDGRDRSYRIHVPPNLTVPAPVVIALHGGGGTGEQFQTENGMDEVADREGFLVVYPEGTGVLPDRLHTWNSGFNCCGYSQRRNIDDVGFLRAVIGDLPEHAPVDPDRIYMTGHSNGSMMSYRFAAEAADLVAAIVPVGGAMAVNDFGPSESVPVLHIHSVDDPRGLYGGGEGPPFPGTDSTVFQEPVIPGIEQWVAANGCDDTFEIVETATGSGESSEHTMERLVWVGCNDGVRVEHVRLTGTGHGWPGVTVDRVWQSLLGEPTNVVNASELVWEFASQFSR